MRHLLTGGAGLFGSHIARAFGHVDDAVQALVGLMDAGEAAYGEVYNVGAREETTIMELAERVIDAAGSTSDIVTVPYEAAYGKGFEDMRRRVPDTSKIEALLGWQTTKSVDDILSDVVTFVRESAAVV